MKKIKKVLTTVIIGLFCTTNFAYAADPFFSDVPASHQNYVSIKYLNSEGILKGYEDNTFKPDQKVNRAEALKIILAGTGIEVPEKVEGTSFTDVKSTDWFAKYIIKAKELGIVNGNPDGSFAPARTVARSEFIKMLLMSNGFKTENWTEKDLFADVPKSAWFNPYMNYAGQAGLIIKDDKNNLYPSQELTRAEVAEILFLMTVIRKGGDTQFLLNQAESEMAQIEIFIGAGQPLFAKRASELGVDMTQQAYKNLPDNNIVIGAAKLARSYDFLMNAFIMAIQKRNDEAKDWANQAIAKATEAWESNNDLQEVAKHIKSRANEIITQIDAPAATPAQ